jgi:hypothetical protein
VIPEFERSKAGRVGTVHVYICILLLLVVVVVVSTVNTVTFIIVIIIIIIIIIENMILGQILKQRISLKIVCVCSNKGI